MLFFPKALRAALVLINYGVSFIVKLARPAATSYACLSLTLASCGGSSGPTTSGGVYMGPIANATVSVYQLAADGSVIDGIVARTQTASDGTFALNRTLRYPVLVRATGGSYEEESNGKNVAMQEEIDAVYLSAPSKMIVSAYSNAIVAAARGAGGLTADNVTAAISLVNAFAGDIDVQQTAPAFTSQPAPSASSSVSDGAKMALALGAESQSRTTAGISIADSTQNIVAQAANGDTLAQCNVGAGNPSDGVTLTAPANANCAVTVGAASYVGSARNRSGVASVTQLRQTIAGAPAQIVVSSAACRNRVDLLNENRALFDRRASDVQARLTKSVTAANWTSVSNAGTWGPRATTYGPITTTSCNDTAAFQQELVMAVEDYWVDQDLNYCHHHIPAWVPPVTPATFRNSDVTSTAMTCAPHRLGDGVQTERTLANSEIKWQGVDCSDFTSWAFNFAGVTHAGGNLETGIGTQACSAGADPVVSTNEQPGVLLDINKGNIDALADHLRPGDLLYITETAPATSPPSNVSGGTVVSHVVTWTGKRYSDLANANPAAYNWQTAGQKGSRLGGNFGHYFSARNSTAAVDLSQLGTTDMNPWMIIDSHFAGPAYRPFIQTTSKLNPDWYVTSLSHVRRIIDAESVSSDPVLAPLVIHAGAAQAGPTGPSVTLSSSQPSASGGGYRLVYERASLNGTPTCYRVGAPVTTASAQ